MVNNLRLRLQSRRYVLALAILLLFLSQVVLATSPPRRPLKRIAHPSTLALEILPRQRPAANKVLRSRNPLAALLEKEDAPTLLHSDSFRLTLDAFDETFHLHLRPNDHLVHSAARINVYKNAPHDLGLGQQRVLDRTIPLLRENVRAYMGEVVAAPHSHQRMREDAAGLLRPPRTGTASSSVSSATSSSRQGELGWARIVVHSQGDEGRGQPPVFEGAFEVQGVTYHVQTRWTYERNRKLGDPMIQVLGLGLDDPDSQLVIWRDTDLLRPDELAEDIDLYVPGRGCSHDELGFNADPLLNPVLQRPVKTLARPSWWADTIMDYAWRNSSKAKRDDVQTSSSNDFSSNIGQTTGCPTSEKVIYMGVATDCAYTAAYGSVENATKMILTDWNSASSLYTSTFNVSLGIIELNVQEAECPSTAPVDAPWNVNCSNTSVTLNDRLSLFSSWRGSKGDDGTGLWHLMSGCPTGTEVGVAWLGTLCQQTASGSTGEVVSGTAVTTNGLTEWMVVAHEIGHNFGAIHDCQDGCNSTSIDSSSTVCCPLSTSTCDANDQFIMSPVTSAGQNTFSQCSLGNICSVMQSASSNAVNTTCLVDPSSTVTTITLNMCGNGVVESGEDCDPGANSNSTCCDASTCKFTSGSVCDPYSDACCSDSCQFASSGTVCRPAVDASCDIAETCTGSSGDCPADQYEANGKSCGSGLQCADGICTSLDEQCQTVGASLNLSKACSATSTNCQVSCEDPTDSSQCVQLQAQLVDGSSCGLGGTCQSGSCVSGSVLDTAKAWYVQNLQISIPVTVVVAIILIFLLLGLFLLIKRCRAKAPSMEPALKNTRGTRLPSYDGASASGPAGPLAPVVPFASRPVPDANQSHTRQMSDSSAKSFISGRRASIPATLQIGRLGAASTKSGQGHAPPGSPRNQSWDGVVSGGSSTRSKSNASASQRTEGAGSRARQPAFALPPGPPPMAQLQNRQKIRDESKWVDPSKWNG